MVKECAKQGLLVCAKSSAAPSEQKNASAYWHDLGSQDDMMVFEDSADHERFSDRSEHERASNPRAHSAHIFEIRSRNILFLHWRIACGQHAPHWYANPNTPSAFGFSKSCDSDCIPPINMVACTPPP